jgi:hypothetical protein
MPLILTEDCDAAREVLGHRHQIDFEKARPPAAAVKGRDSSSLVKIQEKNSGINGEQYILRNTPYFDRLTGPN